MNWVLALLLFILGVSLWKGMIWLAAIAGIVIFLIFLGETKTKRPAPSGGKNKKEEEVLTPVIVTDEGEPPWLYPPKFKLKVHTGGKAEGSWGDAIVDLAALVNLGKVLLTGEGFKGYKFDERWGAKEIYEKRKGKKDKDKDKK